MAFFILENAMNSLLWPPWVCSFLFSALFLSDTISYPLLLGSNTISSKKPFLYALPLLYQDSFFWPLNPLFIFQFDCRQPRCFPFFIDWRFHDGGRWTSSPSCSPHS
jgi:hypothetical protein